ncbi:hypothetical protein MIT9_P1073 [Methylomarinovum caldicuralii]|uniref:Cytochrome c n=1 Tax=Methylomarinovum caldicuralii TaxID=438856 RepID=A0AAU9C2U2_9GAMM|nr:cytochrome C [Methylomarinovum caldicuralii]BCX81495.1 hypothetical protein MIT9_P1073 [Methylomarinovum caldicuralii]
MKKRYVWLLLGLGFGPAQAKVNWIEKPVEHPAIPLLDENGRHVLESGMPYSPRKSCAGSGCHDYDKITSAYHFEMGRDEARDDFGKFSSFLGAKSLVSPGWFGGFNCMGGSIPTFLANKKNGYKEMIRDYGAAGFINCSSCHVGGGFGEKDREGIRYTDRDPNTIPLWDGDYYNRGTDENNQKTDKSVVAKWDWHKSGLLEADCMWCHMSPDEVNLPDERMSLRRGIIGAYRNARREFISGGWFRYAANTAWEFVPTVDGKQILTIERDWREGGESYDLKTGEDGNPVIHWNPEAFDENGRVHVKMLRFPESDNCMSCHLTSNSRRGFYGYGDNARMELGEDGTLVEDYQDDVHKGKDLAKYWHGESRIMDNCNVCHSRAYLKTRHENVNLDQDHNFMKGNSDMDIRNDLDFSADLRTCEYCHVEGRNPRGEPAVIPSGQDTLLAAHLERWKNSGYMTGYSEQSLNRVVQTHFNVLNCQTCHITGKKGRGGKPLQIMYRYRDDVDQKRKIIPYNPRLRYLWIDTTTGWTLTRYERGLVARQQVDENGEPIKDGGNFVFDIVDPETGEKLPGTVLGRVSHGSIRLGDPTDADGYRSLKRAYDKLMQMRHGPQLQGRTPDVKMVWLESNEYIISHNVRPAVDSVPCGDCHAQKQDGSYSSLLKEDGILGSGNRKDVTTLPDPKLVEEGVVVLGMPYMRIDGDGNIYENEKDILFTTLVNPFMTVNDAPESRFFGGFLRKMPLKRVTGLSGLPPELVKQYGQRYGEDTPLYALVPRYGKASLRKTIVALPVNTVTDAVAPKWRAELLLFPRSAELKKLLNDRGFGDLASDVIHVSMLDDHKRAMTDLFGNRLIVKLPYRGRAGDVNGIDVLMSVDGREIHRVDPQDIVDFVPATQASGERLPGSQVSNPDLDVQDGYVIFLADQPGFFAVVDR